jgi:hypothetical protein
MTNQAPCPNCDLKIDATAAALTGYCPECDVSFTDLVRIAAEADPGDAGPYYEVDG